MKAQGLDDCRLQQVPQLENRVLRVGENLSPGGQDVDVNDPGLVTAQHRCWSEIEFVKQKTTTSMKIQPKILLLILHFFT